MTKIDLNLVWTDARELGRANKDLLTAISGMFLLLPLVLALQFIVMPEARPEAGMSEEALEATYRAFMEANWHILFGTTLAISFGTLAMLILLLRPGRPTVAEALKAALTILPSYLVASLVQNLALQLGLILFVIPALYLSGRFALIAAVAAAETQYNPLTIVIRSFQLSHRNGWRIFAMQAVIGVVMGIIGLIAVMLTGLAAALLLSPELGDLFVGIVGSLVLSAILLMMTLVAAALYRAASLPAALPWQPEI